MGATYNFLPTGTLRPADPWLRLWIEQGLHATAALAEARKVGFTAANGWFRQRYRELGGATVPATRPIRAPKLSTRDVEIADKLRRRGVPVRHIAYAFDVSDTTMRHWLKATP